MNAHDIFNHYDELFKNNNLPIQSDDWQSPWIMYSSIGNVNETEDLYEVYVNIEENFAEPSNVSFSVYDWTFAKYFKDNFNYKNYDLLNFEIENEKEGQFFEFRYEVKNDDEMIKFIKEVIDLIKKANLKTYKELYKEERK